MEKAPLNLCCRKASPVAHLILVGEMGVGKMGVGKMGVGEMALACSAYVSTSPCYIYVFSSSSVVSLAHGS